MILIPRVSAERAAGITALNGGPARHRSVKRAPVLSTLKVFAAKHQCAVWADHNGTTTRDDAELYWEFSEATLLVPDVLTKVHAPREHLVKNERITDTTNTQERRGPHWTVFPPMPNVRCGRGLARGTRIW